MVRVNPRYAAAVVCSILIASLATDGVNAVVHKAAKAGHGNATTPTHHAPNGSTKPSASPPHTTSPVPTLIVVLQPEPDNDIPAPSTGGAPATESPAEPDVSATESPDATDEPSTPTRPPTDDGNGSDDPVSDERDDAASPVPTLIVVLQPEPDNDIPAPSTGGAPATEPPTEPDVPTDGVVVEAPEPTYTLTFSPVVSKSPSADTDSSPVSDPATEAPRPTAPSYSTTLTPLLPLTDTFTASSPDPPTDTTTGVAGIIPTPSADNGLIAAGSSDASATDAIPRPTASSYSATLAPPPAVTDAPTPSPVDTFTLTPAPATADTFSTALSVTIDATDQPSIVEHDDPLVTVDPVARTELGATLEPVTSDPSASTPMPNTSPPPSDPDGAQITLYVEASDSGSGSSDVPRYVPYVVHLIPKETPSRRLRHVS